MLVLVSLLALAAPPDAEPIGFDVLVSRRVDAGPKAVFDRLIDARNVAAVAPDCMRAWSFGSQTSDVGARFGVVYRLASFRRKADVLVSAAAPGRYIDWDHQGNKGFVTRWTMLEADGGTDVFVRSYIDEPPWPFKRYYERHVQPAWRECYTAILEGIATSIPAAPAPEPPSAP